MPKRKRKARSTSASGHIGAIGVSLTASTCKRYRAYMYICVDGKKEYPGTYDTAKQAATAHEIQIKEEPKDDQISFNSHNGYGYKTINKDTCTCMYMYSRTVQTTNINGSKPYPIIYIDPTFFVIALCLLFGLTVTLSVFRFLVAHFFF